MTQPPPAQQARPTLDIKVEKDRLRQMYRNAPSLQYLHALVCGDKGAGKTRLFKTMPKPVFIFSFDPGGTQTLKEEIAAGDIVVDTSFEDDSPYTPMAYGKFVREFNRLGAGQFFREFASVGIDGLTAMSQAMIWHIIKKQGRTPPDILSTAKNDMAKHGMQIPDWATVINLFTMHTRQLNSLPCHTLMTGHIAREKDEVQGGFIKTLMLPGQSRQHVPNLTPEAYILFVRGEGARYLLTQNDGQYQATTKHKFEKEEEADLTKLIVKAGLVSEDKPPFFSSMDEPNEDEAEKGTTP